MRNLRPDSTPAAPTATPVRSTMLTGCDLVPLGDGNFRAVPHRHKKKLTVKEATRMANYSRDTIYRLVRAKFVASERQSPRKILIDADSLQAHLEAVRDPAFWTPARRERYWSV